jgi:hypothetical protein
MGKFLVTTIEGEGEVRKEEGTVDHYCRAMLNPKMGLESSEVKL